MSALASKADVSFYEHTSEFERTSPISQLRTWPEIGRSRCSERLSQWSSRPYR